MHNIMPMSIEVNGIKADEFPSIPSFFTDD